jgi:hypothetical protein
MTAIDTGPLVAAIARKRHMEPPERRTFQRVRRSSRPRGEPRPRPVTWRQANERIRALHRWERKQVRRERAKIRGVGYIGVAVFEFLARRAVNRNGRLDDLSYEAIGAILGYARSAIVAACARLKRHGWLDWQRCFVWTGQAGIRGPQVEQTYNAFWILAPIEQLLKLGIRLAPPPDPDESQVGDAEAKARYAAEDHAESPLGRAIAKLGDAMQQRETS